MCTEDKEHTQTLYFNLEAMPQQQGDIKAPDPAPDPAKPYSSLISVGRTNGDLAIYDLCAGG